MKQVSCLPPLFMVGLVLTGTAGAERPTHSLLMPYTNQWRQQDFGALDLLSLLRCDEAHWKDHSTANSPESVAGFVLAFDTQAGKTVLFYGIDELGIKLVSETWEWDGAAWTQVSTMGPPGRVGEAMVYDASAGMVFLYGGQGADLSGSLSRMLADSWIRDGSVWTELHPSHHPVARAGHAMAFDAARGEVVLFGGDEVDSLDMVGPYLNDTWVWNGMDWELKSPANSPAARFRHAMTYDANRQRVVLFGGDDGHGTLSDTWEWDGTDWIQITTPLHPSNRRACGMTYDSRRKKVVLQGGELGYGYSQETWEYDASGWTQVEATNPPDTNALVMAYDSARGETVLFTGEQPGATYVYDGESSCAE